MYISIEQHATIIYSKNSRTDKSKLRIACSNWYEKHMKSSTIIVSFLYTWPVKHQTDLISTSQSVICVKTLKQRIKFIHHNDRVQNTDKGFKQLIKNVRAILVLKGISANKKPLYYFFQYSYCFLLSELLVDLALLIYSK